MEDQVHHVETEMDDTHHDDYAWLHDEEQHEDKGRWGQSQQNSWIQHDTTYGNNSGVGSSGEESSIFTLLENMRVEQQERHQEESHRCDAVKASQEERFILVHEHVNFQDTNFNNFATYVTEQFNQIRQDMTFNHGATQIGINNMIGFKMIITIIFNNFTGRCVIFWMSIIKMRVMLDIGVGDQKLGVVGVVGIS